MKLISNLVTNNQATHSIHEQCFFGATNVNLGSVHYRCLDHDDLEL